MPRYPKYQPDRLQIIRTTERPATWSFTREPVSGTEFFDQDTRVTVQLRNNQTSTCWTSEFTSEQAGKNNENQVQAVGP